MKLSIIIPAYNEEKRIKHMLDLYIPFFSKLYGNEFEMIVVVNGSCDKTENITSDYAERYPQVQTIIENKNIGKGGAIMLGFARAKGEKIGFVDADGATPPESFQELAANIEDAGVIIASRWMKESKVSPRQPLSRRIASRIFNRLIRILFGFKISDTQCGAKLMTAEAIKNVLPNLGVTHWAFDVDLLFKLHMAGFKIKEIPTTWHDVSGSNVKIIRASAEMITALTRLRLLYSPFKSLVALYDKSIGRIISFHD